MPISLPLRPINPTETRQLCISQPAAQRLKDIQKEGNKASYLKIVIDPGGCSGFQYMLSLIHEPLKTDIIFTYDTVNIVTDEASLSLMENMLIDYEENLMGSAFLMKNPNATSACGCGNSFSVF